ncbi:MAG: glycosyltransferase family 4 protein [Desulfamplus sp.]|nr:glycosyltransferase family 4 protein [Desulfamplus sp.]
MRSNIVVLNILPHFGGGVGSVLRALFEAELINQKHIVNTVASLEHINDITKRNLNRLNISWIDRVAAQGNYDKLIDLIPKADIVLVHWWNHPFLMNLLFRGLPPCRLALWSHVNGFSAPQSFFSELFSLPDRFVFATKSSYNSPVVQNLSYELNNKLRVIQSCAGIPADAVTPFIKDEPFQFGYVGTVEPAKMHPNFLKICAEANISSKCIVAGGPAHNELSSQAEKMGIANQFDILGHVDEPNTIFRRLNALAYPLNPKHYGSGEQVLIEAMAYGVTPVVFDNPPEKAIIRHRETGIIAHTEEEFTNSLRFLYDNPGERIKIAEAGRQFVFDECDIKISVNAFNALYEEMMSLPKSPHKLSLPIYEGISYGSPFHLFLVSCGSDKIRDIFKNIDIYDNIFLQYPEFQSITRGTPQHYLDLLGYDPNLELICKKYNRLTGTKS